MLAVGNALGEAGTVTAGIVSALGRSACVTTEESPDPMDTVFGTQPALPQETDLDDLIQTDAHINPGNSGGALADLQSRVVGVCTLSMTLDGQSGSTGVGFAIPIEVAFRDAQALLAAG